jgi:hypothetical protein
MSTVKLNRSTRAVLTTTAADNLGSATYVSCGTYTLNSSGKVPLDLEIEVSNTPGTVSGANPQVAYFLRVSLDGTNYSTGPVSATTTTDEPNLIPLGALPCRTNSTLQRSVFSVKVALGFVPYSVEVVAKNETGAALASSGNAVHTSEVTGDIT